MELPIFLRILSVVFYRELISFRLYIASLYLPPVDVTGVDGAISDLNDGGAVGAEKRRYARKTVMWSGTLSLLWGARLIDREQAIPGVVRDLSVSGARFQTRHDFHPTDEVVLSLPRFGSFNCHLVWKEDRRAGLDFVDPPEFIYNAIVSALPGISLAPNPGHPQP